MATEAKAFNARKTYFGMKPSVKEKAKTDQVQYRAQRASVSLNKLKQAPQKKATGLSKELRDGLKELQDRGARKTVLEWTGDDTDMEMPAGFGWDDDAANNDWVNSTATSEVNGERQAEKAMVKIGFADAPPIEMEFPIIDVHKPPDAGAVASIDQRTWDQEKGWKEKAADPDAAPMIEKSASVDIAEYDKMRHDALDADLKKGRTVRAAAKKEAIAGVDVTDYNSIANKLHDPQLDSAARASVRVTMLKEGLMSGNTKKNKNIKIELETIEVKKGGTSKKRTTAKLAPKAT